MSVDVANAKGEETFFSNAGWAFLLRFATAYGWQPSGTVAPDGNADWTGKYDPAQGQIILAQDAKNLSVAILRGLDAADRSNRSDQIAAAMSREAGASIQPFTLVLKQSTIGCNSHSWRQMGGLRFGRLLLSVSNGLIRPHIHLRIPHRHRRQCFFRPIRIAGDGESQHFPLPGRTCFDEAFEVGFFA